MANLIYFYIFFLKINIHKSFCNADHVLTAETSFSIFTPWIDPNAVNTVFIERPKDKKRATSYENILQAEDQIMIRIRIGPSHNVGPVEKYLVINDIYDPKRQTKDKALVPYVIEVLRGEPVITYSLDYLEDVKFDGYKRLMRNREKDSQQISASKASEEYKPAAERLNTVMKKLSEMFENGGKKTGSVAGMQLLEKVEENEQNKQKNDQAALDKLIKMSKETQEKESKNSAEPGNDAVDGNSRESNVVRLATNNLHNGHRLENSCLKRNIFENWKRQKAFDEHGKISKFKKRMSVDGQSYVKSAHTKIETDQIPVIYGSNSLKSQHLLEQQSGMLSGGQQCDDREKRKETQSDADQPLFITRKKSNFPRKNPMGRLDYNMPEDSLEQLSSCSPLQRLVSSNLNNLRLENVDNEELLRILRTALKAKRRPATRRKPRMHKNQEISREIIDGSSNENPSVDEPLANQQNSRVKRSVLETVLHKKYKNEDSADGDQCDKSKMTQDNSFDLQACDTCGGKSKKTQKPPIVMNIQRRRNALAAKQAFRRQDESKPEICRCRTHESACICSTGKKFRSSQDPAWFSVFNLNSPTAFVTSRIRIFRKRRGIWWEVAPPTDLNTVTGVYSDGNFSFSFSSPIEFFQLEKALRLQDQKLLFPNTHKEEPIDQSQNETLQENIEMRILNSNDVNSNPGQLMTVNKKALARKKSIPKLRPLTGFGFFPKTMKAIERCPYNDKRICLNMLTDEAPASTFKVQMPFQDNVLINKNTIKIQISNIIADATTKDAMQISVLVINKGVKSRLVTISINNCPTMSDSCLTEAKTSVEKILLPYIAETATFLLPLIQQAKTKHKKFECQVVVSTRMCDEPIDKVSRRAHKNDMKVVAKRKFLVEPDKRCLCIWHCDCHCISRCVAHDDYRMCQLMSPSERKLAGFPKDSSAQGYADGQDSQSENVLYRFIRMATYLLLLMLLLGLIKAILGLCSTKIDRCCFDYMYPNPNYDSSSRTRRFCGNVFLFVIFPFRFLCTCFTPSPEDLLVASSEWQCCQEQGPMCEDEFDEPDLLVIDHKNQKRNSKSKHRLVSGIEAKQQEFSSRLSRLSLAFQQEFSEEEYTSKRIPKSTSEIIRTLSERRDQRRQSRQNLISTSATGTRDKLAYELVQSLLNAKRVYRTLKEPIGNVSKIPHGVKYCIQGYFIATLDSSFEFVSFQPLVQYRGIASETFFTKDLHPPIFLSSGVFSRRYSNEVAVLKAGDITVHPPDGVPCINVRVLDDATDTESSSATSFQRQDNRREQRSSLRRSQR